VTLPAHLEALLPTGSTTFTLTAQVALPPGLQGRPLTLAIAQMPALARLRAGGREAVDLESSALDRYGSQGQHAWRIDPQETRTGTVDLEISAERTWTAAGWVNTVPRLSATPCGDRFYVFIARFDQLTAEVALATTLLMSFAYGVLYLLDRRRKAHAWFALQGLFYSAYPATVLGLTQPLFGTSDLPLAATATVAGMVCTLHLIAELAGLPPPGRLWWYWVAATALAAAFARVPINTPPLAAMISGAAIVAGSVSAFLRLLRAGANGANGGRVAMVAAPLAVIVTLGLPDVAAVAGFGDFLGGLRTACVALILSAVLEALILSRQHDDSARRADRLNAELGARVELLARNNQEIRGLNEELRHQITQRSERFAEALARLGPLAPVRRSFEKGELIDRRYRVLGEIGEGGMGMVYEVERVTDDRRLALKVLLAPRSGAELARLAREAEIAARVDHPNVVGIVDVNIAASGALFIVMERVVGTSLDSLWARYGEVPWALEVLRQVAAGLAALHAKGIVHRDLKPGNVLVANEPTGDVAKIADFGIASRGTGFETTQAGDVNLGSLAASASSAVGLDTQAEQAEAGGANSPLTREGEILGTPIYMAPELLRGARLANAASDVYSLGVIAWEVLTGALPAGFESLVHLRTGGLTDVASIGPAVPSLSPVVAALLDACLSHEPAKRPSAAALADALATAGGGAARGAQTAHANRSGRLTA
jgi:serine/threonine-protein kinase